MKITWLSHSSFMLKDTKNNILIDPFISGNPQFPAAQSKYISSTNIILLTHGHPDHIGDSVNIAKQTESKIVTSFEIGQYLLKKGVKESQIIDMNIGGSVSIGSITIHMVQAVHSNCIIDGDSILYGGFPSGFVVETNEISIYHTGDTGVFYDMKLIQEIYKPKVGLIPIGDRFTMSPKTAAFACNNLLELDKIIPMHYDTFPILTGKPNEFKKMVTEGEVIILAPGETIDV